MQGKELAKFVADARAKEGVLGSGLIPTYTRGVLPAHGGWHTGSVQWPCLSDAGGCLQYGVKYDGVTNPIPIPNSNSNPTSVTFRTATKRLRAEHAVTAAENNVLDLGIQATQAEIDTCVAALQRLATAHAALRAEKTRCNDFDIIMM